MLADTRCLDCGKYHFGLEEALGSELQKGGIDHYPRRGEYYFDVFCPACGRKQGLVIERSDGALFTIWPCAWNDEPCTEESCEYCKGEYVA